MTCSFFNTSRMAYWHDTFVYGGNALPWTHPWLVFSSRQVKR